VALASRHHWREDERPCMCNCVYGRWTARILFRRHLNLRFLSLLYRVALFPSTEGTWSMVSDAYVGRAGNHEWSPNFTVAFFLKFQN
jgi:hypothetical protein